LIPPTGRWNQFWRAGCGRRDAPPVPNDGGWNQKSTVGGIEVSSPCCPTRRPNRLQLAQPIYYTSPPIRTSLQDRPDRRRRVELLMGCGHTAGRNPQSRHHARSRTTCTRTRRQEIIQSPPFFHLPPPAPNGER
jgi:hypothetical protein